MRFATDHVIITIPFRVNIMIGGVSTKFAGMVHVIYLDAIAIMDVFQEIRKPISRTDGVFILCPMIFENLKCSEKFPRFNDPKGAIAANCC